MGLKITIDNAYQLRGEFVNYNRNNYSLAGYEAILELFEDTDIELDIIAICCDYTESDKDSIIEEYNIIKELDRESDEDITDDDVLEFLTDRTWAVQLDRDTFLYQAF